MNWNEIGDWAEEMSQRIEEERYNRLREAIRHFGLDEFQVLRNPELAEEVLSRYEREAEGEGPGERPGKAEGGGSR